MVFDFTKYGFQLKSDDDDGCVRVRGWILETDNDYVVGLSDYNSMITIETIREGFDENNQMICNRYECKDYKDVEFLLFKGRIGFLFTDISK